MVDVKLNYVELSLLFDIYDNIHVFINYFSQKFHKNCLFPGLEAHEDILAAPGSLISNYL